MDGAFLQNTGADLKKSPNTVHPERSTLINLIHEGPSRFHTRLAVCLNGN